nr:MAG TPA: hypothetical protein [Caudoviricetes sp.]
MNETRNLQNKKKLQIFAYITVGVNCENLEIF